MKGIRTYSKAGRTRMNIWNATAGWSVKQSQLQLKALEREEKLVFKWDSDNRMRLARRSEHEEGANRGFCKVWFRGTVWTIKVIWKGSMIKAPWLISENNDFCFSSAFHFFHTDYFLFSLPSIIFIGVTLVNKIT